MSTTAFDRLSEGIRNLRQVTGRLIAFDAIERDLATVREELAILLDDNASLRAESARLCEAHKPGIAKWADGEPVPPGGALKPQPGRGA